MDNFPPGKYCLGDKPHTLINYFREQISRGEELVIQDTYRYICERDEFDYWIKQIPSWSCEINVPGKRMTVQEIVNKYVYAINNNS